MTHSATDLFAAPGTPSSQRRPGPWRLAATGPLDTRSLAFAAAGGIGFYVLAAMCLALSRFDAALASLWLPNAAALATILLARLRNEIPFLAAIAVGSAAANYLAGNPFNTSLVYTAANVSEVILVAMLLRRACGGVPDMSNLFDLGRFLQYGGVIGPVTSAAIASIALVPGLANPTDNVATWFLSDSMGMILVVPGVLLLANALKSEFSITGSELAERTCVVLGGLAAVALLVGQNSYPLLFLVPPITLLMAFRIGGLGTALFVPGLAAVTCYMTYLGYGPVMIGNGSEISKIFVLQSFVAANFLTGLPIVAILNGRAQLTEELRAGKSELSLLAHNVTDAVLQLDRGGVVTYASPSTREVLGRDPRELVGATPGALVREDASDRIAATLQRMMDGETDKERVTYRRLIDADDGTPVFIEADCAVTHDAETGERNGYIVSARDMTERVELELLLTRARRNAENAARAKSEFLANMSHEIRTPMNGVLGFAELILQDDLNEDHRRHTEMIVQSGRSMMLLLNDILDLSKIEAGQITIEEAPVDLCATIAECAALHRPTAEKKGLELDFVFETSGLADGDEENPWVLTDALRLRQVVLNLVGNAVKFTEFGGVTVTCLAEPDSLSIEVADSGIGISASRIDTIFAPFTQGESDTSRRYGGTGLGLSISRQLAELLGGGIEVESHAGEGSVFRLTLPARYVAPEEQTRAKPPAILPQDLPQAARVLLVEDHDVNRLLGTEMLERCGQSVAIAHDGNEAIAMVIDSVMRDQPYDLVLMDIQMPGCDGYAATRAIRAEGIGPDTLPIVALTANAIPEDIAAAREAGMQAHLAKPLVFADLARALQRWLPVRIVEAGGKDDEAPAADECAEAAPFRPEAPGPAKPRAMSAPAALPRPASSAPANTPRAPHPVAAHAPQTPTGAHSPALLARWTERRAEAIEAVRTALEEGALSDVTNPQGEDLARIVHKLAGTAAMFGEAELGDQAAAFERALRMKLSSEVQEALAFELLSVADEPSGSLDFAHG